LVRALRQLVVLVALLALTVACGSSKGPSASSSVTTQPVTTNSEGGTPEATGGGSGGGTGANGSVTYEITGDYTTSGSLPFVPLISTFANGGWVAIFGEDTGDMVFQINSIPGTEIVNYGDSQIAVPGTRANGCTIEFTQNDATGLVGTFECHGVVTALSQTGAAATVDFSGDFDAHP
jgi:hypothetical protein